MRLLDTSIGTAQAGSGFVIGENRSMVIWTQHYRGSKARTGEQIAVLDTLIPSRDLLWLIGSAQVGFAVGFNQVIV